MNRDTDVIVVGAGVVGLAVAASLIAEGHRVIVLERRAGPGLEVTARNSEVIHAGIYYPEGSLKAKLCVAGREALYQRCERLGIGHRRTGKLIVASALDELEALEFLRARGSANGVPGLEILDERQVQALEPDVRAVAALYSPTTGIVDSHGLCLSYAAEAERGGAMLVFHSDVKSIQARAGGWNVEAVDDRGETGRLSCGAVVNAAGLASDEVARRAGMDVDASGYRLHLCKGDYFSLSPSAPVSIQRLVYPLPAGAGLGVHANLDLGGRIRFGPDVEYVDEIRFDVDPDKRNGFARQVARYLPDLRAEWLEPEGAGIRPKLSGPGEPFRDFVVAEESAAGFPGLVNCIGIESPGLTAAAAIASRVVAVLASL
jgi:L-2-hydroxyglutarate oxidase LhgO